MPEMQEKLLNGAYTLLDTRESKREAQIRRKPGFICSARCTASSLFVLKAKMTFSAVSLSTNVIYLYHTANVSGILPFLQCFCLEELGLWAKMLSSNSLAPGMAHS